MRLLILRYYTAALVKSEVVSNRPLSFCNNHSQLLWQQGCHKVVTTLITRLLQGYKYINDTLNMTSVHIQVLSNLISAK